MMLLASEGSFILDLFRYEFLQYSLFAGLILGFITPLIGSFVVIRRLSFIADTLSHFSLAGLSIGLFLINTLGLVFIGDPLYLAVIAAVIGAFIIEILRGYYVNYKEISMPIVMSLGTALSALFISLAGGWNSSIYNFLFGSLLTVGRDYLALILVVAVTVILMIVLFYKQIVLVSFDEAYAKLVGIKINRFQFMSTLVLALVVSLSIVTVGVLLVSSLMIIPVAAAMKVGKSFRNTITIAILFSELSVLLGSWISYELSVPPGASIVLINIIILFLTGFFKRFIMNKRLKQQQREIQAK
ncbi:metal ABC transporter permease [Candidatus Xianfuyuplasma coldseepsis]|uniref:Metal ABC transporter permease n=1 Tax=Candidatus Xianfuyuplasma coldseepsis TaxID=2782163 RepID=A0A7L7KSM9_9MOLU|nr:metal ABC transporter permease [Xianfuyuplasma coldseepsis]QMS85226.1 metal ABC transporter permease [Xianfuyuplasma coldseepsis]